MTRAEATTLLEFWSERQEDQGVRKTLRFSSFEERHDARQSKGSKKAKGSKGKGKARAVESNDADGDEPEVDGPATGEQDKEGPGPAEETAAGGTAAGDNLDESEVAAEDLVAPADVGNTSEEQEAFLLELCPSSKYEEAVRLAVKFAVSSFNQLC